MNIYEILDTTTQQYRKGPEVVEHDSAPGMRVVEFFAMPRIEEAPSEVEMVDVHFMVVGVDTVAAESHRDELLAWLATYPEPDRLAGGPSYIELGAVMGDQSAALQLMALGQALGLWQVITPEVLHITGPEADKLAGSGFVMMSGYDVAKGSG